AVQVLQGGKRIPVVKRPGETLSLSCRGSGFTFSCCSMHWIRQPAGKGLEWMGRVYSDASRTDYSSSLVDSSSKVYLQMKNLKTEDTAVYNCARRDTMRHKWSSGPQVPIWSVQLESRNQQKSQPCFAYLASD
uniref:Ig-like domain-containing protein n=1 Tax=Pundamilia nyererei TaxID=303518 RepID=A0A3B4H9D1_9CICH